MKIIKKNSIYKVGDIIKLKSIKEVDAIYNKYVNSNEYTSYPPNEFLFDKTLKICEIISFDNFTCHQRKLKEKLKLFNTAYKASPLIDSNYPIEIYTIYDFEIENFNIYI